MKDNSKLLLLGTVLFFGITPVLSYFALKVFTIDVVYTATAVNIVIILLLSWLLFGEQVEKRKIVASAIIVAGIVVFNL